MGESNSSLSGVALFFVLISLIIGASYAFDTIGTADINGTKVYMANFTDDPTGGNWIHLSEGHAVELPEMTLNYSVKNASYTKGSSFVELNTHAGKGSVKYPYKYHRYYLNGSNVNGIFYGGSSLNNSIVDYYLIKTSSTELNDTFSDLLDGNATSFENMLDGADRDGSVTANSSGDAQLSLSNVPSGSYALLLLLNKSSYSNLSIPTDVNYTILSSTVVEVVEFPMQVSTKVDSDSADISMKVSNTTTCGKGYRYGAVAIRDDAYTYSMDLVSNGSKASTNASINDVPVIEGFDILGLDLGNVNVSALRNKIGRIIGSGNGAVAFSGKINKDSTNISMILNNPGGSKLMTGVWSYCSGEKLVSFNQTTLPTWAKDVTANQNYTVSTHDTHAVDIEFTPTENGTMTLNIGNHSDVNKLESSTNNSHFDSYAEGQGQESVDKFTGLNVSGEVNESSFSSVIIKKYYTTDDLDNNNDGDANDPGDIKESSLKLYRYCSADNSWDIIPRGGGNITCGNDTISVFSSGVDTTNNYVWANLSHFSVYGIAGSAIPTPVSVGGEYTPKAVLLANSIDAKLAENFTAYMEEQGIDVIYTTPKNFSDYNKWQYVIMLGGQEAYEGVGEIVGNTLTEEEKADIMEGRVFLKKTSVFRPGGIVYIYAGKDREATAEAWEENYREITKVIKYNWG